MPNVEWEKILEWEGGILEDAYVPRNKDGSAVQNSGVTIAGAVDLGGRTPESLLAIGVPLEIVSKIPSYAFGIRGSDAVDVVERNPFSLDKTDANILTQKVKEAELGILINAYESASGKKFDSLPPRLQTVAASVGYQYGSSLDETKNFKKHLVARDDGALLSELADFGDPKQPTRHLKHLAYLLGETPKSLQKMAGIGFWDRDGHGGPQTTQALLDFGIEKFGPLIEDPDPDMLAFIEGQIQGPGTGTPVQDTASIADTAPDTATQVASALQVNQDPRVTGEGGSGGELEASEAALASASSGEEQQVALNDVSRAMQVNQDPRVTGEGSVIAGLERVPNIRNTATRKSVVDVLVQFGTTEGMKKIREVVSASLGVPLSLAGELDAQAEDAINLASHENPEIFAPLLEGAPQAESTPEPTLPQATPQEEETDFFQEAEDVARSFAGGALQGISDIPRALGTAFNSDSLKNAADAIDSIIDAPEENVGFIDQVARGLGQVVTMIGGGLAGGALRGTSRLASGLGAKRLANARGVAALDKLMFPGASAAAMGGAEQVRDYYDTQREKGLEVDRDTELTALYLGSVIGSLDLLFPGRVLKTGTLGKFTKNFDEWASKGRLKSAAAGALVEGSTEATQASLSNGLGNALYDADNDLGQFINDALNEGSIGGAVGAILGALLPRGIGKAGGAQPRKITDDTATENVNIVGEPQTSPAVETVQELESDSDTPPPNDVNPLGASVSDVDVDTNPPGVTQMDQETMSLVGNIVEGKSGDNNNIVVPNPPAPDAVNQLGEAYRDAQRNSVDPVYHERVLGSYEGVIEDVTNGNIETYEQLVSESLLDARKEIEEIYSELNIELVQGKPYSNVQELANDVAANRRQRFVPDKGGLLDTFIDPETQNITHADALQAILDSVGRLNAKVGYGYHGDQDAYNQVHAMFSPLAQLIVATQLRGRIANQYSLPAHKKAFTRLMEIDNEIEANGSSPKLLRERAKVASQISRTNAPHFILEAQYTRPELPQANPNLAPDHDPDVVTALHRRAVDQERQGMNGVYEAQDPLRNEELGNSFRAGVERILPQAVVENRFAKPILDWIQFDILNAQVPELHHHIRSVEGGKEVASFKAKQISEKFTSDVEAFIQTDAANVWGESIEERSAMADEILSALVTGEIQFALQNPSGYINKGNMIETDSGYLVSVYMGNDGNPGADTQTMTSVIPSELVDSMSEYVKIMDTYRRMEVENVEAQITQTAADIVHTSERIRSLESILARTVRQGLSLRDVNYPVFDEDPDVRQEWMDIISGDSEVFSYIPAVLEDYFANIAAEMGLVPRRNEDPNGPALRVARRFYDNIDRSNNVAEFISKTSGIFGNLRNGLDAEALLGLGAYRNSRDHDRLWRERAKEMSLVQNLENQERYLEKVRSNMFYFGRAYRAHHDPDWVARMSDPRTQEEKARYDAYVLEVANTIAEDEGGRVGRLTMDRADKAVQDYVRDIKNNNSNLIAHQSRIEGGAKIASPSMRKGVISPVLRDFLGEYTQAEEVLEVSINRLSDMAVTKKANNQVYDMFLGHGLYQTLEDAPVEERGSLVKITLPEHHNLSKFQGMYAQPVIAHTIGSFVENEVAKGMLGVLQKTSGQFRQWNTIYSLATGSANIIAGMTGILSTGGAFNMFRTNNVNAGKVYLELMKAIQSGNIDYLEEAIGAVGGSEAHVRDIMQHQRLAKNAASVVLAGLRNQPVPLGPAAGAVQDRVWEPFSGFMHSIYKFGDLAPKIYGYYFNKELAMSKLGLGEEQAKDFATKITRDTLFDYDQVPHIVKTIRDFSPLGGGFLSWQTLTFTTMYHTARYVRQIAALETKKWGFDNITGFDPSSTVHLEQARKGFMSSPDFVTSATMMKAGGLVSGMMTHVIMGGIIASAGGLISALFGDDDTEEDLDTFRMKRAFQTDKAAFVKNMSNLMPEYYKDTAKSIVDINENGNVEFINTSRLSNYGNFVEAFNSLMRDDIGDDEALGDFMGKMFGDYFNAAFGLQLLNEMYNNETQFGQQIYAPSDSLMEQTAKLTAHSLDYVFWNSSFEQISDQVTSLFTEDDYNKHTGQPVNLTNSFLELAGLRKIEFDPKKSFASQSWQDSTQNTKARKFLSDKLRSYNKLSDAQIAGELARAKKTHEEIYEKMLERIESARFFGMSESDIKDILRPITSFGKNNTELLLRGQIPAFQLKQIGGSRIASNALKGLSGEAKDNFKYNYEQARLLNNE